MSPKFVESVGLSKKPKSSDNPIFHTCCFSRYHSNETNKSLILGTAGG